MVPPVCGTSVNPSERILQQRGRKKKAGERQKEKESREQMKSKRTKMMMIMASGCLNGVDREVVWGQSIFLWYIFFILLICDPGEPNAIMARAIDVCLVDDWLVWHLILWLTVKDGVVESWEHPRPPSPLFPTPFCPSRFYPPLYPFHHLSTLSAAIYPSLSCFPTKCLLKTSVKCGSVRFNGFVQGSVVLKAI